MAIQTEQLYYENVKEGDEIPKVTFHLTIQRMVMAAASNRDFATIHHNTTMGQAAGAPDMFLNNVSCLSMWERVISDWIGIHGKVKKVGFRITTFAAAGDSVEVGGTVTKKWQDGSENLVELDMISQHARGTSMAGHAIISLPLKV